MAFNGKIGWQHYDLQTEVGKCNMAMLLELFKRETDLFKDKCHEYATVVTKYGVPADNEHAKKLSDEASFIDEGRYYIAMKIAEKLTDTELVQREIIPKPKEE